MTLDDEALLLALSRIGKDSGAFAFGVGKQHLVG